MQLYGRGNNVLNCMSRKVYTVVMVNHDRPACVMALVSPSMGNQPMQILDWFRTWLGRVSAYTRPTHVRFSKIKLTKSVSLKTQFRAPAYCQESCGLPRRHYVTGSIRQCFLYVLYFVAPRLIHRFVQGSNMVQERLNPAAWVGSSGSEEPREAGQSGSLVIRKTSP
jgi:hypothetical protein